MGACTALPAPATNPKETVPLSDYHAGVIFRLPHPGPSQMGCPYCIDTLQMPVNPADIGVPEATFRVEDRVVKTRGYYFPGVVRAVFQNGAGETRLVVESSISPGLLHIFSPSQLEHDAA